MNGILHERLVIVSFSLESLRRVEKVAKVFVEKYSEERDGFPIRIDSIGWRRPNGIPFRVPQVIFTVWYPTEKKEDVPFSVDRLRELFGAFVKDTNPSRSMTPYYAIADRPVAFDDQLSMLSEAVIAARSRYMNKHGFPLDDVESKLPLVSWADPAASN